MPRTTIEITESFDQVFVEPATGKKETQLGLPLEIPPRKFKLLEKTIIPTDAAALFKEINRTDKRNAKEAQKELEKKGIRIFHAITENDTTSVEADFGAPLKGLDFALEFVDLHRSFRYDPVRTVEGCLKTHVTQTTRVAEYLRRKGFQTYNGLQRAQYPSNTAFINGGVTAAFNQVASLLVEQHEMINKIRAEIGRDRPGVFLVPVPTYGLFLSALKDITKGTGVEIVKVPRHDNGAVDQSALKRALMECKNQDKYVLGYYDCTPHNPTGYIRTKEETIQTAKILEAHSIEQAEKDYAILEQRGEEIDPSKWYSYRDSARGRIVIIDDMAYEGLEITRTKRPFSFAQIPAGRVSKDFAQQVAVLKGVSKIGLPGARIGLLVASNEIVEPITDRIFNREFTASSIGADIITARYSSGPHQKRFAAHQKELAKQHRRHLGMLVGFVRGIDNTDLLTQAEKREFIRAYASHTNSTEKETASRLKAGHPFFHIKDDVEAGFFTLLNLERLRNKEIQAMYGDKPYPRTTSILSTNNMYWVLKAFKIGSVPMVSAGTSNQRLETRITFSLPQKTLFTLFDRLHDMHEYFFGNETEYQLDLFRDNKKVKAAAPTRKRCG